MPGYKYSKIFAQFGDKLDARLIQFSIKKQKNRI